MDFLKSIFGIKPNDKNIIISGIKSENYIKIINDQISNLVNIGLSPIPSTKDDKILQQADLNRCLIRIIYFLDILLMDRLTFFQNNTDKKFDVLNSNHSFNPNSERHYWVYISKYFNIPSVKFLTMYDIFKNNQEKGLAWLTISILENTLLDSFKQIYTMNFDKKFYEKDANIIDKKSEILKSIEKLSNFNLLNSFNVEIYKDYINDKNQRNANRENMKDFDMGLDVPGMSPIKKPKINQDFIITPIDLVLKNTNFEKANQLNNQPNIYNINLNSNFQPSSNFYNSRENISTLNIYQSKISIHNTRDLNSKAEDYYKLINADESGVLGIDENEDLLMENDEDKEEDIKEKDHPRNTRIITTNDINSHYKENKNLGAVKRASYVNNQITLNPNENVTTYNISKYMDIQQCLKENYFTNIFNTSLINLGKKDNGIVSAIANKENRYFPFDRHFRVNKKVEKDRFTKKDIIYYNNSQVKMTNSIVFYFNNLYKKKEFFVFDTRLTNERPITIEAQNFQCQLCRKKFPSYYSIFPFRKIFWCSYYKRYICDSCVSDEFSIIPAFVLKKWNFQKFSVSKEAIELLKNWFKKPILYFKSDDPIIKISSMLKQAIVIKRKIHKIYDIMKCPDSEKIANEILGEYSYLVIKENLFSLRDLWEIHNGSFILKIKDYMFKLENHIKSECAVCNYKGGICAMCTTGELITAYDIENAFFCNECNSLFHKKCCSVHPCLVNKM